MIRLILSLAFLSAIVTQVHSQVPFHQGVNLTQWFQASSVRQIQFSKFSRTDFEQIKALGCDVIRLPINLHAMTTGAPDYAIDPLFFQFIDEVVGWSEDLNMHLILDNHTFDPNENTDPEVDSILTKVWRQIAAHYKDDYDQLYYEVLNEPHGISAAIWGPIQQSVINAIRKTDTRHYIIVGGVNYNSYNDLATLPNYSDKKLIYTFHFYDPFLFTHQGAGWTSPSLEPLAGVPFPYGASSMPSLPSSLKGTWIESAYNNYAQDGTAAQVKKLIDIAASFSSTRNVPVFCGEFGVFIPNSNDQQRVAWYKLVRDYLIEKKIPWTMWDYRGTFGLFEKNTAELYESDLNVSLLQALSLNVPPQSNPSLRLQTESFDIYDDYIGQGIIDVSGGTNGILDYYNNDSHDGKFAIHLANVDQYFAIGLDFRPNMEMSLVSQNNYALDFWVKGDAPGSSFDVRFVDSKTSASDHPWRKGITIDQSMVPWDNAWHHVIIPLSALQEKGSYDNGWFPPEGKFSWHDVDRFEIVAEAQALQGISFHFDEIRVNGDPIVVTSVSELRDDALALYPNPASANIKVTYKLNKAGRTKASLITPTGSVVRIQDCGELPAGSHQLSIDVSELTPGLYILQLITPSTNSSAKVIVR
ncbi:MAG: cellulase family glycosylhydrolase [Chryseolinea sp.]